MTINFKNNNNNPPFCHLEMKKQICVKILGKLDFTPTTDAPHSHVKMYILYPQGDLKGRRLQYGDMGQAYHHHLNWETNQLESRNIHKG